MGRNMQIEQEGQKKQWANKRLFFNILFLVSISTLFLSFYLETALISVSEGELGSETWLKPLFLLIILLIIAGYSFFQLEKKDRKIIRQSVVVHEGDGIRHWLFSVIKVFNRVAGILFSTFRFFLFIIGALMVFFWCSYGVLFIYFH